MFDGKYLNPYYSLKVIIRIAHILPMLKLEVSIADITVSV